MIYSNSSDIKLDFFFSVYAWCVCAVVIIACSTSNTPAHIHAHHYSTYDMRTFCFPIFFRNENVHNARFFLSSVRSLIELYEKTHKPQKKRTEQIEREKKHNLNRATLWLVIVWLLLRFFFVVVVLVCVLFLLLCFQFLGKLYLDWIVFMVHTCVQYKLYTIGNLTRLLNMYELNEISMGEIFVFRI